MVKNAIKVYARLKPEKNRKVVSSYRIHRRPEKRQDEDFLLFSVPPRISEFIDNRPESWNFSFRRVFEERTKQQEIFEDVARPVIESVLDGYNGTIFAYGQTGSGKTYTITGDQKCKDSRGIIPRTLEHLFEIIRNHPENVYSVEVAYLEIYNENGYDLLDRKQSQCGITRLEDLPRVTIQEDEAGKLHLKNLTFHYVANENEALEFLLIGDGNRVIAETPMNPHSSRSHCIFTIVVSVKQFAMDRYKRAKMHLVDLAGSERVYKCAITGTILTEAKHINLSLHYLEQVIVCLGQENTAHIPYRNSLLTGILRDSLGGNCLTTMLATLSVSSSNLEETMSTCRFAQRVALIRNDVGLVLEKNTETENTLLKLENERLRQQVAILTKQNESYDVGESKNLVYYKNLVVQRDKEISLLIDMLKKEKIKSQKKNDSDHNCPALKKCTFRDTGSQTKIIVNESVPKNRNLSLRGFPNIDILPTKEASLKDKNVQTRRIGSKKQNIKLTDVECQTGEELNKTTEASKIEENTTTSRSICGQNLQINSAVKFKVDSTKTVPKKSEVSAVVYTDLPIKNSTAISNSASIANNKFSKENFEKSLPLTGDPEIDEEIVAFYKAQRSGSVY